MGKLNFDLNTLGFHSEMLVDGWPANHFTLLWLGQFTMSDVEHIRFSFGDVGRWLANHSFYLAMVGQFTMSNVEDKRLIRHLQ